MARYQRAIALYLAVAIPCLVGYFVLPEPWSAACWIISSVLPVIGLTTGVLMNNPSKSRPWMFLAAGQLAFLVADLLWFAAYLPALETPAIPHVSDLFYLAGYPLLAFGVVLFIRARQPRYRLTAAIDAMLIGFAAIQILWLIAIDSLFHDEALAFGERFVLISYQIGDVVILAAAAYLLLSGRQAKGAFYILFASLTALCLGDFVFLAIPDPELAAKVSDLLWATSYALFGIIALVPSMRNLTEPSDAPTAPEGTARLLLLGAALTVIPAFAIYQRLVDHQDLFITGICGAFAGVAILVRMRELGAVHRRVEHRYSSLLANASDAFAIVSPEGRVQYVSPASQRVLGYEANQLVGRSVVEVIHPRAVPEAISTIRRVTEEPGRQLETELRMQRGGGEWRWLSIIATNRTDDPDVHGIVLNFRDVTERHEDESRLDMQARVLNEVQHAVLVTDGGGRIAYWNQAAESLFGWKADDVMGRPLRDIGLARDPGKIRQLEAGATDGGRLSGEFEMTRRDGRQITVLLTNSAMQDGDGEPSGMIAVAVDISDRKELESRLQEQAFTDALTGLANRALFVDRVAHVLARGKRSGGDPRLAVLFLDVDDFKTVNDSMGHIVGDELLKTLGQRLTAVVRPTDTAARLGGDEFAVLLEDSGVAEAERVSQRLLTELAAPVYFGERQFHISVSIGIAVPEANGSTTAESLLRDADLAMYRAKARLQGGYAVYQPGMHEAALRRLELKADLQRAIDTDELDLHYQPIFRLDSGAPVAAEALLRWTHPERGPISVAETLALADATGLMVPVGAWVVDQACMQASAWRSSLNQRDATEFFVSVNASARELLDPSYVDLVANALTHSGLPADALAIEITESDLMQESEATIQALQGLKDLGVRLAIDDFGTGYSSLAYLARFPLDILKIDKTFVSAQSAGQDGAIARAIIDLARSLDLSVVAEGIESAADRDSMQALGAHLGQGYFLARPMTSKAVLAMLAQRRQKRARSGRVRGVKVLPAAS